MRRNDEGRREWSGRNATNVSDTDPGNCLRGRWLYAGMRSYVSARPGNGREFHRIGCHLSGGRDLDAVESFQLVVERA